MPYITHRTPRTRPKDTPIGKALGYMTEILEYLRWENYAFVIDQIWPEWPVIGGLDDILIKACQKLYNRLYQRAYEKGADRGNQINAQVMGWVNDAKRRALALVNDAKKDIETRLINPIKKRINTEIKPQLDKAMKQIKTFESKIQQAQRNINNMNLKITAFDKKLKDAQTTLENLKKTIADLDKQVSTLRGKVNELTSHANRTTEKFKTIEDRLKELENRVGVLEAKKKEEREPFFKIRL